MTDSTGTGAAACLTVKLRDACPLVMVILHSRSACVLFGLVVTFMFAGPAEPDVGVIDTQEEAFVSTAEAVHLSGAVNENVWEAWLS